MSNFNACTEDDVSSALNYISGDDREMWILMGCAIKNEFGDGGFDLWDSWSSAQAGYNKKQIMTDWKAIKSFGNNGSSVSIATLFKLAIDGGYQQRALNEEEKHQRQAQAAARAKQRDIDEQGQREHDEKFRLAAASMAIKIWRSTQQSGISPYLEKKQVKPYGIGFIQQGLIILYDEQLAETKIIAGRELISTFFADKNRPDHQSFLYVKPGVVAVPLVDAT